VHTGPWLCSVYSLPARRRYLSFLGKVSCGQQGSEGGLLTAFDRSMGCIASRAALTAVCSRFRWAKPLSNRATHQLSTHNRMITGQSG